MPSRKKKTAAKNKKKSAKTPKKKDNEKNATRKILKKTGVLTASELLTDSEKDEEDWEEFKQEKKKTDEVKFEDLEGFDFEDDAYHEPEEKSPGIHAEEVFDDEP